MLRNYPLKEECRKNEARNSALSCYRALCTSLLSFTKTRKGSGEAHEGVVGEAKTSED
jgi:hypothetical protein